MAGPPNRIPRWLKWALVLSCLALALLLGRPALHLLRSSWTDVDRRPPLPAGHRDDASRLNATPVREVWPVPADMGAAEEQLAQLLARARDEGLRVSIAGARHSMGGHTIYPGGISIDTLPLDAMWLDEERDLLHVQAGATWKQVIAMLDAHGRSVAIMQSNNSFSVGGSVSVNCHGWQYGQPPIASSVRGLRLMKADGAIVRCSREENPELFSLALGGYGLFGIILEVELEVVPNRRYRIEQIAVPTHRALETFDGEVRSDPAVAMAYARLCITPGRFLEDVIINVFRDDPAADGSMPALEEPGAVALRRSVFRGSEDSDYGKALRWNLETALQPHVRDEHFSRNQLLNEGVEVFENRSVGSTDILHEYFMPRDGVAGFVQELRRIVPAHGGDLLNVTVRFIDTDEDTFLRYADGPMFALVMLFAQPTTAAGDAAMQSMTREMIDAALGVGGRYYLPYRLHATAEQFRRAYPRSQEFFELKRWHDPGELFQNQFYVRYGARTP